MNIIGLTGGIGSGKTTVAKMFTEIGVPVYNADDEAKLLMNTSKEIKLALIDLFGSTVYMDGSLNRAFLRDAIFKNRNNLKKVNAVVHPAVAKHFRQWIALQNSPYVIKEVAIIFENQQQNNYDYIITVVADTELRINRVLERSGVTREQILNIMDNQLSDEVKIEKSDFVLINEDLEKLRKEVTNLHDKLLKLS